MARRNKSYADSMEEWAEEKRFLRKIRHRAFHPRHDSGFVRLGGYLVRLLILLAILAGFLFLRNRQYFKGEAFRDQMKLEADAFFGADPESSKLDLFAWKNFGALTNYHAIGGETALFKEMRAEHVRFRAGWIDMLTNHGWDLDDVEIGKLHVVWKPGIPRNPSPTAEQHRHRPTNYLHAVPDFGAMNHGPIRLHSYTFEWGSHWTSAGELREGSGTLSRKGNGWRLLVESGVIDQNWLKGLRLDPKEPLHVDLRDGKLFVEDGHFLFGKTGRVSMNGTVTLGETPQFDLRLEMRGIDVDDIVPQEFFSLFTGIADIDLRMFGSTNDSAGIGFEGLLTFMPDKEARFYRIPILRSLSVIGKRSELYRMPIKSGSTVAFETRKGVLNVTELDLQTGEDVARVRGGFTYKIDTDEVEQFVVEELAGTRLTRGVPDKEDTSGFDGAVQIGLPWDSLGGDVSEIRDEYFKREGDYAWITVPLKGPLPQLTAEQARILDLKHSELDKRAKDPLQRFASDRGGSETAGAPDPNE